MRSSAHPSACAASAIAFGDAASASVSVSRDFEMSQFWQKRQARSQPAVPNESTELPGKKWLSGFFSIGSTQKPLERPYVVSTTASTHAPARSTGRAGLRAGDDPPGRAGPPLPLTDPELVEHEHPEGVKLVVADASRENGQLLRRVERNPRRLVDELGVDL
jgi:hypothetical protein